MEKSKKIKSIVTILFLIIGLTFLISGIFAIKNHNEFLKTAQTTTAEITKIDRTYNSDGDYNYTVYVEFSLNGKIYGGTLGEYNSSMRVGDNVTVYYNPSNPNDFNGNGASFVGYILMVMGVIFTSISSLFIMNKIKVESKIKKLKTSGIVIQTDIINIALNTKIAVNNVHPYIIECTGIINGIKHNFKSENIWFDANVIYNDLEIKNINVYVNPEKINEYYVDIENFKKYLEI